MPTKTMYVVLPAGKLVKQSPQADPVALESATVVEFDDKHNGGFTVWTTDKKAQQLYVDGQLGSFRTFTSLSAAKKSIAKKKAGRKS